MKLLEIAPREELDGTRHCAEYAEQVAVILSDTFCDSHRSRYIAVRPRQSTAGQDTERLTNADMRRIIKDSICGDDWAFIRDLESCRFIFPGYDKQLFVCMRHEDEFPASLQEICEVIESSDLLTSSDIFDGYP